ncbi:T9SS type A sorting domain-containing protein [bacterium]|nr:T9SS type A sorting domain-containing protein [bacterium]
MPEGWSTIIESQNTAANVWVHTSNYDAYSGTNFIKMYGDTSDDQDYLMLITPELTQLSDNQLSFYAKSSWGQDTDSLRIGSMSDPTDRNTFTELYVFPLTFEYQEFSVDFTADNSDNYIAFLHKPLGSVGYSAYIDDISWESTATVPNPATLVAPTNGAEDVVINYHSHGLQFPLVWSSTGGSPTSYILNFGTNYPPDNIINNQNIGNVTEYYVSQGLEYSTQYFWQIIPINDSGSAVDCPVWGFITMDNVVIDFNQVDEYTEGFESAEIGALPLGWEFENLNEDTCWWEVIANTQWSDNANSGEKAAHMRFSFSDAHDDWLFSPAMNLIAGNTYTISFWYKNSPFEDSVEKMNFFVGNSPTASEMNTELWDDNNIINSSYMQAIVEYTPEESGLKFFGWHAYSDAIQMVLLIDDISISQDPVSNDNDIAEIRNLALSNYPNPFNPETRISFSIPKNEVASIKIYNLKGQLVKEFNNLTSNETHIVWNGRDNKNKAIPSGIYLTKLLVGSSHLVKKITLLK